MMTANAPPGAGVLTSSSVVAGSRTLYFALFVVVTLGLILPIWTVSILPWTDFANHLGRIYILAHYADVPSFQQNYEIRHIPEPNLAIDLIGPVLIRWFDPYVAGRIFASLSVAVFALGCHLFGRAVHSAPTWLAIPSAFLFYNSMLLYGYVNYTWSIAMFLIAAAAWLHFERSPSLWTGLLAILAASATYISHLGGFVSLCAFIGLCVAYSVVETRGIKLLHLCLFIPLLPGLAAYFSLGHGENAIGSISWPTWTVKFTQLWIPFSGYATWMDVLVLCGLLLTIAMVLWNRAASMDRRMLVVTIVFFLMYCVFPDEMRSGGQADARFLMPAVLLAALAVVVRMSSGLARIAYALMLAVFAIRIGAMTVYWKNADAVASEQRQLLQRIDEGTRIYPLVFLPQDRTERKTNQGLIHLACYAAIDRHGISASTFTYSGEHSIRARVPLPYTLIRPRIQLNDFEWPVLFGIYDYVWSYNPPPEFRLFLDQSCDLVARAGAGSLYRTRRARS